MADCAPVYSGMPLSFRHERIDDAPPCSDLSNPHTL